MKENCPNSKTSDDIDMKLGPVTQLDKRNKTASKNLDETSCRKIVTSLLFFQFMTNLEQSRSPGHIVCETYNFINSNLLSYKN